MVTEGQSGNELTILARNAQRRPDAVQRLREAFQQDLPGLASVRLLMSSRSALRGLQPEHREGQRLTAARQAAASRQRLEAVPLAMAKCGVAR